MADEPGFPNDQWDALKAALAAGGAVGVAAFVNAEEDLLRRRQLWFFLTGQIAWPDPPVCDLDTYVAVCRAAIDEFLRQAAAETDPEAAARRTDLANIVSYNLSARLADCWEDTLPRPERRHMEAGLAAADDCLRWREELGKGANPFAIAWWAKGAHLLALGRAGEAVQAFTTGEGFSIAAARESVEGGGDPAPHEHFGVALAAGYRGIAEHVAGDAGGKARYDRALADFARMAEDAAKRDDAEMGSAQLRTFWSRYGDR